MLDLLRVPRFGQDGTRIVSAATLQTMMRRLPVRPLDMLLAPGDVLVLAPHPDDEVIGCGGLIAEAQAKGRAVHIVFLTDGSASHPGAALPRAALAAVREDEAHAAARLLRVPSDRLHFLRLADRAVPVAGMEFDNAVAWLAELMRSRTIGTVLATAPDDPHPDHQAAFRMASAAVRQTGARLLCYPVWQWRMPRRKAVPLRPVRGSRLSVRPHLSLKRAALLAHASQVSDKIPAPGAGEMGPKLLQIAAAPFETFLESGLETRFGRGPFDGGAGT